MYEQGKFPSSVELCMEKVDSIEAGFNAFMSLLKCVIGGKS